MSRTDQNNVENHKASDDKPSWFIFFVRVRRRLEGILGGGLAWILRRMSRKRALRVADFLAWIIFTFFRRNKRVSLDVITLAFGDKYSKEEKLKIIRKSQVYMCRTIVDFLKFSTYTDEEMLALCSGVTGREHLERALEKSPGGVIGLTGHIGAWEYGGAWVVKSGWALAAVGKEQRDPGVTKIMLDARAATGIKHIPRTKEGNTEIIRSLRTKNTVLGLVSDQNGGWDGVFVDFFGIPASSVKGPAYLALKFNVPVVPIFAIWDGDRYRMEILPEVEIARTGDPEKDILVNTQKFQKVLEVMVRKYPEQWLWGHRRWKTRPAGEGPVHKN